jgi:membrane-bound lytic murein transglycosylase D
MKTLFLFCVLAAGVAAAETIDLDQMIRAGAVWLHENLDEDALADLDEEELIKLCRAVQARLDGDSVTALAEWEGVSIALLPFLEQYEETKPYAGWLRNRLDYLAVAKEFKALPPLPQSILIPSNPSAQDERDVWKKLLQNRQAPSRAREQVPVLRKIFQEAGVPTALVWVAEVESSFDPKARSPAGAVGLFQLMPVTAESLGLKLLPEDQRLLPEPNARAAAKYLRELYSSFKDWRLALAAYNAGQGRVRRLLEKHKAASFDAISPFLPAETQLYVPKVEAVVWRRAGVKLEWLKPPAASYQPQLGGHISSYSAPDAVSLLKEPPHPTGAR